MRRIKSLAIHPVQFSLRIVDIVCVADRLPVHFLSSACLSPTTTTATSGRNVQK